MSTPPFTQQQSTDPEIDIRGLLMILWRRRLLIMGLLLIFLSLAAIVLSFVQPRYSARAHVLLDQQSNVPSELQALARRDNSMILSEVEIIRSRTLAQKAVERLGLMGDPGFNPRFSDHRHDSSFKTLSVHGSAVDRLPADLMQRDMEIVVTNFLKHLDARVIPGSGVIQITYRAPQADRAALIANTLADVYIDHRLQQKIRSAQKTQNWLDGRLNELREDVRVNAQNVADYRAQHKLGEGVQATLSAEQLSRLNAELINAQTQQAELQARLTQIRRLARNTGDLETAKEIVSSGFIQRLKANEAALLQEIADLSVRYGPRHPAMIQLNDELKGLRDNIADEMDTIATSVENELKISGARVAMLEEQIETLQTKRHGEDGALIALRELEGELDSSRRIFENFLENYKRATAQEELQEPDARIISYAVASSEPAFPNKPLILALTGIMALFLGVALAFLFEKLHNHFRSAGQLEEALGLPCFALIPKVNDMLQKPPADYVLHRPHGVAAEAIRTLRTVLGLRSKGNVITVTSSFPGEGKTTLSAWLGRIAAKSGEKVIIIDADLRRPKIHRAFGKKNTVSLVDYLTGEKTLDEVLQKDEATGAHMLYGRAVPGSALQHIGGKQMQALIEALRQSYDLVILDSPACMAVSDARVLAGLSDQLLYAVAWDATPREIVAGGVKQFTDLGYDKIGFVLTNVDVQRHVRYGYGDTVYYYGRNDKYA